MQVCVCLNNSRVYRLIEKTPSTASFFFFFSFFSFFSSFSFFDVRRCRYLSRAWVFDNRQYSTDSLVISTKRGMPAS